MLRQDDYQKSKLVEAAWRHGKDYGGHLASCIIMSCISNRVRLGWGSWLEVIDRIPAYSATLEQPTGTPAIWEPSFVRLLHEVDGIFSGQQDYAKGGLYWADLTKIDNSWFKEKIMRNPEHPRIVDMNSLSVFR